MTFLVAVLCTVLLRLQLKPTSSPDGFYYLERPWTRPYCMRRLWPWLLSQAPRNVWEASSLTCLACSGWFVGEWLQNPWATVLYMGLPLVRSCARLPYLTDQPALVFFTAGLCFQNPWLMALGGLFNEKVPLFGAVALWTPWPLVGLVPPLALYLKGSRPRSADPDWLRAPLKCAWDMKGRLVQPERVLLPWGALLFGFPTSFKGAVLLAVAYAQLLIAQDGARLYQWAFPALLPGVAGSALLPALALLHWCNPYRESI